MSPARWLLTRLAVVVLAAAVVTGALSAAITWWSAPLDGALSSTRGSLPGRLTPVSFAMRGLVPVGYAVLAVVLGTAIGLVVRRTLPAMALTLGVMVLVQVALPLWVRPHLAPPVTSLVVLSDRTLDGVAADGSGTPVAYTAHTAARGDWVVTNETVSASGAVGLPAWIGSCAAGAQPAGPGTADRTRATGPDPCLARLAAEGYRQRLVYQPAGSFWRLQITEAGLCLLLAGATALGLARLLRR